MTQFGPPPVPPPPPGPVEYAAAKPRISGMAITSLVLGILSIPLMCALGAGILLAIPGLILGIIALLKINAQPQRYGGKGVAIAGITTSAVALPVAAILIAILLPSLGRARELANRSYCAANLRDIAQSLFVYANDNNDAFPIGKRATGPAVAGREPTSPMPYSLASANFGTAPNPDAAIQSWYAGGPYNSPPGNMWILVLRGQVASKEFICKSDPAATAAAQVTTATGAYYTNFNNGTGPSDLAYSYSFAYPLTPTGSVGGWWRSTNDSSLPLIADMAPKPSATINPANPSLKSANSANHRQDGQNVAFADAHVEFCRTPAVGQNNDNIWTSNAGITSSTGTAWTVTTITVGGTPGNYDIMMMPVADSNTHARE